MQHVIIPPRLQKGDTVGIVAPSSSPFSNNEIIKQFEDGIKTLEEEWHLHVKLGRNIYAQHFYSAGTLEQRLTDFHDMWIDPDVKAIIMAIGGSTAIHLLEYLDYGMIQQHPKIFAGVSDGTTLLNPIHAKTGLVTYHGHDMCFGFGLPMHNNIKRNLLETWFEGAVSPLKPLPDFKYSTHPEKEYEGWKMLRSGKTQGRLIGGHIMVLTRLLGCGYLKKSDFENRLLFLEGTNPVNVIDVSFHTLRLAGIFSEIKGLILGHFENANEEEMKITVANLLLEIAHDYSFPIIQIGELGHNVENYCFPIGCNATVDADNLVISIDEATVA